MKPPSELSFVAYMYLFMLDETDSVLYFYIIAVLLCMHGSPDFLNIATCIYKIT